MKVSQGVVSLRLIRNLPFGGGLPWNANPPFNAVCVTDL
jgi:hypothetical protein